MRFMMRTGLPILGIPSILLLFVPYTDRVSPWGTVSGEAPLVFALLGGPFFLSIPILIAQTRVLLKGTFSKGERAIYRLLAYAALTAGLTFLGIAFGWGGFSKEAIMGILMWCTPYAAAVGMMILSARKLNPEDATTVMLQAAWLPNAILCATGFWGSWEIGAYLAAFTIVLYSAEIALTMYTKCRAEFSCSTIGT
jgi:hypothetical protein